MTALESAFLVVAGVAGGLAGSVAGLASLATYPALLLLGLPPVVANFTNTVALIMSSVGSVLGSRPELVGQRRYLTRLSPIAVLGGVSGAVLLLSTPAEGFERIVPFLLGAASLTILIPRRPSRAGDDAAPPGRSTVVIQGVALFLICIYGGYFGAAAGVLLLALLLHTGRSSLPRTNAAKNVLLGAANGVAAVIFAVVAPVDWAAALPLGIGCLIGARIGPIIVRHANATMLRALIGAAGLALAIRLGVTAYRG